MGKETARSGNYAELRVIADLVRRGYSVSIPYGHETRYDLILDRNGQLLRVQVKNARLISGAVVVKTCSNNAVSHSNYKENEIDYIASYEPVTDKVYYVPMSEVGTTRWALYLRVDKAKNFQSSRVREAADFLEI